MSSESDILTARLTRMKNLVEALETACAKGAVERDIFLKLKREMAAAQTLVDTVKV